MQTPITKNELNGDRVRATWQRESIQSCGMNSLTLFILLSQNGLSHSHISARSEMRTFFQKGKPIARWGRKAAGSPSGTAWLLKGVCDGPDKHSSQ